jgi:hypothetical protein
MKSETKGFQGLYNRKKCNIDNQDDIIRAKFRVCIYPNNNAMCASGQTKVFLLAEKVWEGGGQQPELPPPDGFLPCRGLRVMVGKHTKPLHVVIRVCSDPTLETPSTFAFSTAPRAWDGRTADLLADGGAAGVGRSMWFMCSTRIQGMAGFPASLEQ